MQAEDIESYLAELGMELQNLGAEHPIRVLLVGGAYMLTQMHNRASTNDVDVLLKDLEKSSTSPTYQVLKAAARLVAQKHNLPGNWFNDVIGDFLQDTGTVPEGILWSSSGMLEIYIPPAEYILALKLFAGRPKDRTDIYALCQQLQISFREQAQLLVNRYITNQTMQQLNHLDETLDELFP